MVKATKQECHCTAHQFPVLMFEMESGWLQTVVQYCVYGTLALLHAYRTLLFKREEKKSYLNDENR